MGGDFTNMFDLCDPSVSHGPSRALGQYLFRLLGVIALDFSDFLWLFIQDLISDACYVDLGVHLMGFNPQSPQKSFSCFFFVFAKSP